MPFWTRLCQRIITSIFGRAMHERVAHAVVQRVHLYPWTCMDLYNLSVGGQPPTVTNGQVSQEVEQLVGVVALTGSLSYQPTLIYFLWDWYTIVSVLNSNCLHPDYSKVMEGWDYPPARIVGPGLYSTRDGNGNHSLSWGRGAYTGLRIKFNIKNEFWKEFLKTVAWNWLVNGARWYYGCNY